MFNPKEVLQPEFIQQSLDQLKEHITPLYCVDEDQYLRSLIPLAELSSDLRNQVDTEARQLIHAVRADEKSVSLIDSLLLEYSLDTQEGILLMCLAEALLRIPDKQTADALIRDKLTAADWAKHLKNSDSLLVNASSWGLLLTGKVINLNHYKETQPLAVINRLVKRMSEPVVRKAMNQAMKIMGKQFVLGRSISEALKNGAKYRKLGYTYSFDMLGEAALTQADADFYYNAYLRAIETVGADANTFASAKPSVSIKLSALHPRYESTQSDRVLTELLETLCNLVSQARHHKVDISIDAEEADRLEISLQLFEKLYCHDVAKNWGGLGLVVQAYSKRALPVLVWLAALAKVQGNRIPVRLVKGAYWDSEIKLAQQQGLDGYPVFTRKEATDSSYLACARFLLAEHVQPLLYPQFASHNAHTIAAILTIAEPGREFELQRLHGMGDALYDLVLKQHKLPVRIYAPVGEHKDLLPYLVRRLLENGANSSFVHRLIDSRCPVENLIQYPVEQLTRHEQLANPRIPLPRNILGKGRLNSAGVNIFIESQWQPFSQKINTYLDNHWQAAPLIGGQPEAITKGLDCFSPHNCSKFIGSVYWADQQQIEKAFALATGAFGKWNATPVAKRATCLNLFAKLLEENIHELIALCHLEAGKTIQDSIDEIREAVDFCRYYAEQAQIHEQQGKQRLCFDGRMATQNIRGKGVFVCISPWNFPVAIFIGQIVAALVMGNTVIAKAAEQTSLIAMKSVELLLKAGIPGDVISLLPGDGAIGAALVKDPRVDGVAFTGSLDAAHKINQSLASNPDKIPTFIAETGGQNAMIVDSTALPEQVVTDVVHSAFASAGQRCSALRVLYVQEDVADHIINLLKGAMAELTVGNPCSRNCDVGPVIDQQAQEDLLHHIKQMSESSILLYKTPVNNDGKGFFVAPTAFEIKNMNELQKENFGPILHVIRFSSEQLDQVIDEINASQFGLTLGIHTRNEQTAVYIDQRVRVGNVYVNRNQIGAVVGFSLLVVKVFPVRVQKQEARTTCIVLCQSVTKLIRK